MPYADVIYSNINGLQGSKGYLSFRGEILSLTINDPSGNVIYYIDEAVQNVTFADGVSKPVIFERLMAQNQ